MKQLWKKIFLGVGIFFLLPIGITQGISGNVTWNEMQEVDWEKFLPILLCQQIDGNYEAETLKAQAVLARSSLSLCVKKNGMTGNVLQNLMGDFQRKKHLKGYQQAYENVKLAVEETKGQVLVCGDRICEGVFHQVSSGVTRGGTEVLQDTSYEYLTSVKSGADISSKNYLHGHYFSQEALRMRLQMFYPNVHFSEESLLLQIQIVKRDSNGYVMLVKIGDMVVAGEEFRINMELASANFSIQEVDGKIRFLCKGFGHGLGMSQFGANEMAKEGSTYLDILKYYFPLAEVKKISNCV